MPTTRNRDNRDAHPERFKRRGCAIIWKGIKSDVYLMVRGKRGLRFGYPAHKLDAAGINPPRVKCCQNGIPGFPAAQ